MNIININSDITITPSQKSFIEEVLFCGDDHHRIDEDSFYCLSKRIPLFLLNEESMRKNERKKEYRYEPNDERRPSTEWLGFYGRDSYGLFEHTPRIAICPERIASCVKNDEEFMFLLAKVIVHEFAHAKLDYRDDNVKYRKKDEFWHWMEESMANQLTLEVFRDFSRGYRHYKYQKSSFRSKSWEDTLFDFVVDFVKKQPPAYALGYELFDKRIWRWWTWRMHKDDLGGQKRIQQKNSWLQYVQSNYRNIDEEQAEKLYDELFK